MEKQVGAIRVVVQRPDFEAATETGGCSRRVRHGHHRGQVPEAQASHYVDSRSAQCDMQAVVAKIRMDHRTRRLCHQFRISVGQVEVTVVRPAIAARSLESGVADEPPPGPGPDDSTFVAR